MRTYTDKVSGDKFISYIDGQAISRFENKETGKSPQYFYACAFDSCTVKTDSGKAYSLSKGECFTTEKVTHRKFAGFKRFSKI